MATRTVSAKSSAHKVAARKTAAPAAVSGKADTGKTDTGKTDTGKADASKADTGKIDPASKSAGLTHAERVRTGSTAVKQRSGKVERSRRMVRSLSDLDAAADEIMNLGQVLAASEVHPWTDFDEEPVSEVALAMESGCEEEAIASERKEVTGAFWGSGASGVECRDAADWAEILGTIESGAYRRTFEGDALEKDFIAFCQMASPVLWSASETEAKVRDLLQQAAGHVVLEGFQDWSAADAICGDSLLEPMEDRIEIEKWVGSPSMFSALCAARIMTVPEEISVVRRMHFLKYLAYRILTSAVVDAWDIVRAHGLLKAAQWHRDLMVRSNMRLVVSIVKRLTVPITWHDELVSDGIVALLRAVDKFDPSRGYRFCTYATPVIRRECFQYIQSRNEDRSRFAQTQALPILASTRSGVDSNAERAHWINWRARLEGLMGTLTRREQLIIRSRYCLGAHRKVKTLQRLAAALKISKERVRQLEYSALAKLRAAAEGDL